MIGMKSLKVLCYSVVSSVGLKLSTILPMTIPYVGSTHPPAREKNTPSQNTNFSHSVEYLYRSVYPALGLGGGFAAFTGAFSSGAFPSLILPWPSGKPFTDTFRLDYFFIIFKLVLSGYFYSYLGKRSLSVSRPTTSAPSD